MHAHNSETINTMFSYMDDVTLVVSQIDQYASSIKEANDAVSKVIAKQDAKRIFVEMKTKIAKFAVENGIKAAVNKFQDKLPKASENWNNTIRDWKDSYLREMSKKRKATVD